MDFIMPRDVTVATRMGHSFEFKKGEPLHVPPECYKEVMERGGVPADELPEPEKPAKVDPVDRENALLAAITSMVEQNQRDDFSANGAPSVKALSLKAGFPVDARERDAVWAKFQAAQE